MVFAAPCSRNATSAPSLDHLINLLAAPLMVEALHALIELALRV